MKMKYTLLPVICLILLACQSNEKATDNKVLSTVKEEVVAETEEVADQDETAEKMVSPENVSLNGTIIVSPQNHASVTIMMGGTLRSISFLPGEYVNKGSVIAKLENPEFINLQQNYLESAAQLEFLETEYNRQKTLSEQEAASKKRFQESKADYLSMKSKKAAAAAQLRILGISPENIEKSGIIQSLLITAPISGYITGTKANLGKYINSGEAICEIVNKSQTMLCLTAYEKDLEYLSAGSPVTFRANSLGNTMFDATVMSIGQEINPVSRSLNVYAKVNNSNTGFRPGMYVTAQIKKK